MPIVKETFVIDGILKSKESLTPSEKARLITYAPDAEERNLLESLANSETDFVVFTNIHGQPLVFCPEDSPYSTHLKAQ